MGKNIVSALFIVVAALVFMMWTNPQINEAKKLSAEKATLDEALSNSKELQQKRDILLTQYNSIPAVDLQRLSLAMPVSAEETKLMLEVANVAEGSEVTLNRFQVQKIEASAAKTLKQKYQKVNLEIAFSASYENALSFMDSLQQSLRLLDIETVSFNAGTANLYEVDVRAKSYFSE